MRLPLTNFTILQKLTAAFLFVAALVGLVSAIAVIHQLKTIERASMLEAGQFADSILNAVDGDVFTRPLELQEYVRRMHLLHKRDIVVVDLNKKGMADANPAEVGDTFHYDKNNEVGMTMLDGKARTFVEIMPGSGIEVKQVVVGIRNESAGADSPIVGAIILEYSPIYDGLLAAATPSIIFIVVTGLASIFLAALFGRLVSLNLTKRVHVLQKTVGVIASGDYQTRIVIFAKDEIGDLGIAVNKMAEELRTNRELLVQEVEHHRISAEKNELLAFYDSLTLLPNRALFHKLLSHCLANAHRYENKFAVFFIDLDRFKNINDTLGHEAGDKLLQEVGARIKSCVRQSDVVARFGGDEFVVLLSQIDEAGSTEEMARKILASVSRTLSLQGQDCRITASIGIAVFPFDGQDLEQLLKHADAAMYQAKGLGKNRFARFCETLNSKTLERLTLESSLRHALLREEFELYYQAKVDSTAAYITGVEALIRWNHPDFGIVSPIEFIPIAEETGLIVEIGKWVLHTACVQNVAWRRAGMPPMIMAVNLSARQLADPSLLNDVAAILEETGMAPEQLELEITESMVMQDIEKALVVLASLKDNGIRIAMDDFGTGYSSLFTLKRIPLTTLKIDRSFIQDIPGDADDRSLTRSIIEMGKNLGLTVVAEGVETKEQAAFLTENMCDELQGFYFSIPLPAKEFAAALKSSAMGAALEVQTSFAQNLST
jgi:diguanylate cyclase (GGDEF)-like protein